ncbi:MAG: NPCBM/NEW2 domain-containing protein [Bryobacteraceae bacterium]
MLRIYISLIALTLCTLPSGAQIRRVPPGGAPPPGTGDLQITGFVRLVDANSLEIEINGNRVAVGLIGITVPQANTSCGKLALNFKRPLVLTGIRLEEDPLISFDDRHRRMYYGFTRARQSLAAALVRAGFARPDGRGKERNELVNGENDARQKRRGCLWGAAGQQSAKEDLLYELKAAGIGVEEEAPSAAIEPRAAVGIAAGFVVEDLASNLVDPTAFTRLPDGRILIAEKRGTVKVLKNGNVLGTPFIDIQDRVNDYWDHGFLGIAADANFAANGYVYLLYTYENDDAQYSGTKTARLTRVTATGDTASPATEITLVGKTVGSSCNNFPVGTDCMSSDSPSHSAGAIRVASDGSLFFTIGDGASFNVVDDDALRAQNLDLLNGKILHVTTSGDGVPSNPFWNGDSKSNRSKVWAYGLRNPYRFGLRPGSNMPYIGDVGWSTIEEVSVAAAGRNLGWPCFEGPARQSGYEPKPVCQALYSQNPANLTPPLVSWDHNGAGAAATGGTFYTGTVFPTQYQGAYIYGDYAQSVIRYVTVDANNNLTGGPIDFANNADGPVDIQMGPNGDLYYLAINVGRLRRIRYESATPPPSGTVYVSDLSWTSAVNGWGPVEKDMSNGNAAQGDGQTLTLGATTYVKGLGVHAASDVRFLLGGSCSTFEADVGVDEEVGGAGSIVFEVWGDSTRLYQSPVLTGNSPKQAVNVGVSGRTELSLRVLDGGDGIAYDHGDWANARLICSGSGPDTTPPTVISKQPADNATGIGVGTDLTATFSEPIDASTLTASTFTLVEQVTSAPVAAAVTYDPGSRTATLNPAANLKVSTVYRATLKGGAAGIKDLAGNASASDVVWNFTTGSGQGTVTYLSDLNWAFMANAWGPVEKDRSNGEQGPADGNLITLNSQTFPKGLGTHAPSEIRYNIAGACSTLNADIGIDDEIGGTAGTVVFQVFGDGTKLYESPVMNASSPTQTLNLNIQGKNELRLVVTDAGDGPAYDHADWAGARISCGGGGSNTPPVPTIATPSASTKFKVGDVINYSGSATDAEDGNIPASGLAWQIRLHHCPGGQCHVHPFTSGTGAGGTFTAPDHGDESHFEIILTATDSAGLTGTKSILIQPQTVQITFETNPAGLQIVYGSEAAQATPFTRTTIIGSQLTISAPSPQGGRTFSSWSDGGAQQHNITVGTQNATYTATFVTASDVTPPVITNVQSANITGGGATITWTTDEAADTQVEYGTTTAYSSSTTLAPAMVTNHSQPLTGLTPSTLYHYRVRSRDAGGNLAVSGDFTFTTSAGGGGDTIPPTVTSFVPADGAMGVSTTANMTATFSEAMNSSTINTSTFRLVKLGTTAAISATVTYNATTRTATLNPSAALVRGLQYVVTIKGGSTGVKDPAGNALTADFVWKFNITGTPTGTPYVSDLQWISATNGWGPAEKDKSNGEQASGDGSTLSLNGVTYPKGLGVHANSDVRFSLGAKCTGFTAKVGVDDEIGGSAGSIIFRVVADGSTLFDSGVMNATTAAQDVNVDVTGKNELRLIVNDGGNGPAYDHGDWALARLTCQ